MQDPRRDQGKAARRITTGKEPTRIIQHAFQSDYTGRFAPSPTGPLHSGSLIAALASYLDARAAGGRWLVRIEDIDPPRESPGATSSILHGLDALGLHWDGKVVYQSHRYDAYDEALDRLDEAGLLFPCTCSRQEIRAAGGVYPGTCRNKSRAGVRATVDRPYALRCLVTEQPIRYRDLFQGRQESNLASDGGDFVVKRKDGLYAYQLAVAVDDVRQNITHVVRGIDLLDSTPKQLYLQSALGLESPQYGHIPVIVNDLGQKLSKQHFARPVDYTRPARALLEALDYLQQDPDTRLAESTPEDILAWGIAHWRPGKLAGLRELREKATLA